jgi:hypothetical protein
MTFSRDPDDMAKRCREAADDCDDPKTEAFLRQLAAEYDELAKAADAPKRG